MNDMTSRFLGGHSNDIAQASEIPVAVTAWYKKLVLLIGYMADGEVKTSLLSQVEAFKLCMDVLKGIGEMEAGPATDFGLLEQRLERVLIALRKLSRQTTQVSKDIQKIKDDYVTLTAGVFPVGLNMVDISLENLLMSVSENEPLTKIVTSV